MDDELGEPTAHAADQRDSGPRRQRTGVPAPRTTVGPSVRR